MNTIKLFVAVALLTLTVTSCRLTDSSDLLTRHWKLINLSGGRTGLLPDSIRSKFISNATMTFGKNNILQYSGTQQVHYMADYKLLTNGKYFTITPENTQKTDTNKILVLTKTNLVFVDPLGNKFSYRALN